MAEHWATEELPGLLWDDDAEPPDDGQPAIDQPPTPHDLRDQRAGLHGLYTAHTIPTGGLL